MFLFFLFQQQQQPQISTCHAPPASGENYSYVQLTAVHEPVKALHEHRPETIQSEFDSEPISLIRSDSKRESCASIKKPLSTDATAQSHKELVHTKRVRCRYAVQSLILSLHALETDIFTVASPSQSRNKVTKYATSMRSKSNQNNQSKYVYFIKAHLCRNYTESCSLYLYATNLTYDLDLVLSEHE